MTMYECSNCGYDTSEWPAYIIIDFKDTNDEFRNKVWLECGYPGPMEYEKFDRYLKVLYERIYNMGEWFCSSRCAVEYIMKRNSKEDLGATEFLLKKEIENLQAVLLRINQLSDKNHYPDFSCGAE